MQEKIIVKQFEYGNQGKLETKESLAVDITHEVVRCPEVTGCAAFPVRKVNLYSCFYEGLEWPLRRDDDGNFELVLPSKDMVLGFLKNKEPIPFMVFLSNHSFGTVSLEIFGLTGWVKDRLLDDGIPLTEKSTFKVIVTRTPVVNSMIDLLSSEQASPGKIKLAEMYHLCGLLEQFDLTDPE
jgi:hypothetical protein